MDVRRYDDDDLAKVVDLFSASVHGLAASAYDATQRAAWAPAMPDLAHWSERLHKLHVLLAMEGDTLAGFIGYEDDGHIDLLFTAPAYARRGVAARLYAQAQRALLASGASVLTTEASELARPFFAAQGFALVETQDVTRAGVVLRRYAMRKDLSPRT